MGISIPPDDISVAERWDKVFRTLSSEPRRQLLLTLSGKSSSEWVQLPEAASSPHYPGSEEDLRVTLYHDHLPRLADDGYVVWNEDNLEARQGPRFGEAQAVLRAITSSADRLPQQLVKDCRTLETARPD